MSPVNCTHTILWPRDAAWVCVESGSCYLIGSPVFYPKLCRFLYPHNVICFLAMTVLVHYSYGSGLFHLAMASFAYWLFLKFFRFWCIIFEMRGAEQIPMCMNHGVYSGVMVCLFIFPKKHCQKSFGSLNRVSPGSVLSTSSLICSKISRALLGGTAI